MKQKIVDEFKNVCLGIWPEFVLATLTDAYTYNYKIGDIFMVCHVSPSMPVSLTKKKKKTLSLSTTKLSANGKTVS